MSNNGKEKANTIGWISNDLGNPQEYGNPREKRNFLPHLRANPGRPN
jgi:hypothetical protein